MAHEIIVHLPTSVRMGDKAAVAFTMVVSMRVSTLDSCRRAGVAMTAVIPARAIAANGAKKRKCIVGCCRGQV